MKNSKDKTKKPLSNNLRKQFMVNPKLAKGETNNKPSLTVPDLTLTIKQLLTNHSRGIPSNVAYNEPMYFNQEIPIIDDIVDIQTFRQDLKHREKLLQAKIKEENQKYLDSIQNTSETSKNDLKTTQTPKKEVDKK